MGTIQFWICQVILLWISNSCYSSIPNRKAAKKISAEDASFNAFTGARLCKNSTEADTQYITFQRLTIGDDILYIGATNLILQINLLDFTISQFSRQGPEQDNPECLGPPACIPDCSSLRCMDNFNRLLLPHRDQLIVCGSALFGTCRLLTLKNISKPFIPTPNPPNAMMCHGRGVSQVGKRGGPMSVASVFKSDESNMKDIFYFGSESEHVETVDILFPPRTTPDGSKLKFVRISDSKFFDVSKKDFLLSWTTSIHGFLLWTTENGETKLARLCHSSLNEVQDESLTDGIQYSKASYTETTIQCGNFRRASLAYQVDQVLYLLMSNVGEYALCSASLASINDHFYQARIDCFNGSQLKSRVNRGKCAIRHYDEKLAECGFPQRLAIFAPAIQSRVSFDMKQRYYWPGGLAPPTALAIDLFGQWEIGYFGTEDGTILKTDINQLGTFTESITLDEGTPVQLEMRFDNSRTHLYATTKSAVYQIKVSNCDQYDDCEACFGSRDPYCGWCNDQSRCTTNATCGHSAIEDKWISAMSINTTRTKTAKGTSKTAYCSNGRILASSNVGMFIAILVVFVRIV